MSLLDLKTTELLDRFAAADPTPGGGSAAALSGALGGALAGMVCAMAKTRTGAADERVFLDQAGKDARSAAHRLRELVDLDAQAFDSVMAAYRLAKGSDEEKAARKAAIAKAMDVATSVPLESAEACLRVLEAASVAFRHGNPNASSDARTGALLALAGLLGGVENVRTNAAEGSPARVKAAALAERGSKVADELGLTKA